MHEFSDTIIRKKSTDQDQLTTYQKAPFYTDLPVSLVIKICVSYILILFLIVCTFSSFIFAVAYFVVVLWTFVDVYVVLFFYRKSVKSLIVKFQNNFATIFSFEWIFFLLNCPAVNTSTYIWYMTRHDGHLSVGREATRGSDMNMGRIITGYLVSGTYNMSCKFRDNGLKKKFINATLTCFHHICLWFIDFKI